VQCSWDVSGLWRLSIPPLLSLDSTAAVYTAACSTNANLCLSKFLGFPSARLMNREWRRRVRHDSPLFSAVRTVRSSAANDALPKSLTASSQQHNQSWNLVCHCLLLISRLDESPSDNSTISKCIDYSRRTDALLSKNCIVHVVRQIVHRPKYRQP
jgi:hypothetical protein